MSEGSVNSGTTKKETEMCERCKKHPKKYWDLCSWCEDFRQDMIRDGQEAREEERSRYVDMEDEYGTRNYR